MSHTARPVDEHLVRSADDQVHVAAGQESPGRTLCGRTVLTVCEHPAAATCSACSRQACPTPVPASYEPCG